MLIAVDQPFDLASTLGSGQAFRWHMDDGWSTGVVFGNVVSMRQVGSDVEFSAAHDDEAALKPLLADYLGLAADLESIYAAIGTDERMRAAIERYKGMRILRQDPWECLVSFMCSPASNILRISKNVESICTAFGRPLGLGDQARCTFPTPNELAEASEAQLLALGLGFRAGRVASAARAVAEGEIDLMPLREASYEEALSVLTTLDGVGDKVANCVLLFSLDKPEAFPVDVWVDRALREWYLDGRGMTPTRAKMREWAQEHFGPFAGYANQYLFHDRRLQGQSRA